MLSSTPSGRDTGQHAPPIRFVVTRLADLESDHDDFAIVDDSAVRHDLGGVLVAAGYDVSRGAGPAGAMDTKRAAASRLESPQAREAGTLSVGTGFADGWSAGEDGRAALLQHIPVIFVPERRSTR